MPIDQDLDAALQEADAALARSELADALAEADRVLHHEAAPQPDEFKALTPWRGSQKPRMREFTPLEQGIIKRSQPYAGAPYDWNGQQRATPNVGTQQFFETPIPAPPAPGAIPDPSTTVPKPSVLDRLGMKALDVAAPVQQELKNLGATDSELSKAFNRGLLRMPQQITDFVQAINELPQGDQGPANGMAVGIKNPSAKEPLHIIPQAAMQFLNSVGSSLADQANKPSMQPRNPTLAKTHLEDDFSVLGEPEWWINNVGEGGGSMVAFMVPSLLTGGGADVAGVEKAATFIGRMKQFFVAGLGNKGLQAGAAFEAATEAGGAYRDAVDHGQTPEQASQIAARSFMEQYGLLLATAVPGYATAFEAGTLPKALAAGFAGEASQEAGQTVLENKAARAYDPSRPWLQGVASSALMGGVLGAGGGAYEHAAGSAERAEAAAQATLDAAMRQADVILNPPPPSEQGVPGPISGEQQPPYPEGGEGQPGEEIPQGVTEPPVVGGPVSHGPPSVAPEPELPPPPAEPPAPPPPPPPPPSINPRLSDELIAQLRAEGVPEREIRGAENEEHGQFILDSAKRGNAKPKVPVRARNPYPQTPGMAERIKRDEDIGMDVTAENILSDLEQAGVDQRNPQAPDYTPEPEHVTDHGPGTAEDAGAGAAGPLEEGGIPASYGPRDEEPEARQQREAAHTAAVTAHVLEAARQLDPAVDESEVRAELDSRISLYHELHQEQEASGRNPMTLLRAIAALGGIDDSDLTGEIKRLKEGTKFGRINGVQVFRNRLKSGGMITHGLSFDQMVRDLQQQPGFEHIENKNDLHDAIEEAQRYQPEPSARDHFPGTKELRTVGVEPETKWWARVQPDEDITPQEEEPAPPEPEPVPAPRETPVEREKPPAPVTPKEEPNPLDDILNDIDNIFGPSDEDEPGSRGAKTSVPFVITRRMEQQLRARGYGQAAINKMRPAEAHEILNRPTTRGAIIGGIDPKDLVASMTLFKKLAEAGVTDFEKAVTLIAGKKGEAWVQNLAPALGKAWEAVRKGNPKMSPAGDVTAILSKRQGDDAGTAQGPPKAPGGGEADTEAGGRGPGPGGPEPAPDTAVRGGEPSPDLVDEEPGDVLREPAGATAFRTPTLDEQRKSASDSTRIAPYARRTNLAGAEHPRLIVEARALAGVPYPELHTRFQSPHAQAAVKEGRVSVEQAEQALAAVQANLGEQAPKKADIGTLSGMLPDATVVQLEKLVAAARTAPVTWHIVTNDAGYSYNIEIWAGGDSQKVYAINERAPRGAGIEWHDGLTARATDIVKAINSAAGQAPKPTGKPGHGYLIADAVGVGKSRELALTMLELMHRAKEDGRELRLLFVTKSEQNITDFATKELPYVATGFTATGHDLATQDELQAPKGKPGKVPFDVITVTDHTDVKKGKTELPQKPHAIYVVDSQANLAPYAPALANAKLHGIVGDEAHLLKNKKAQKGAAWQNLHARIYRDTPRHEQVFVYSTATPAQDVHDFEYLYGLRLWPIDDFATWINIITGKADEKTGNAFLDYIDKGGSDLDAIISTTGGGVDEQGKKKKGKRVGRTSTVYISEAEAEQIPREMKRLGRLSARDLLRTAEYVVHNAKMSRAQEQSYQDFVALSVDIVAAAKAYKADMRMIMAQLTLAGKRQQLVPVLDEAIKVAKKHVAQGYQVVFSVLHRSGVDDLGNKGNLGAAIRMIPEEKVLPDGSVVPIPGAAEAKEELVRRARMELGKLREPGEVIREAFGESQYAEMVGAMNDEQRQAVKQFQAGKRAVIMITAAGSTGVNLQQRELLPHLGPAQGRRLMIPVQTEWSATNEMQRIGRVDRADSKMPPKWMPISFGTPLEERFWGSIIGRLRSMGAMSRGGDSSISDTIGELGGDDVSSEVTLDALREAWKKTPDDLKRMFLGDLFADETGTPHEELHDEIGMKEVQEALALIPMSRANQFWNLYVKARDAIVAERAKGSETKTAHYRGRVLQKVELGKDLTLYRLMDENGKKFGLLQGVVMPHMPRLRTAIADENDRPRRKYGVFETKDGQLLAGLDVLWSRVPKVAQVFGVDLDKFDTYTLDAVQNKLDAELSVPVGPTPRRDAPGPARGGFLKGTAAPPVEGLRLRKNQAGTIVLQNATMKMRDALTAAGAIYNVKQSRWEVPEAELQKFLSAYPPEGQSKNLLPGGVYGAVTRGARTATRGAVTAVKSVRDTVLRSKATREADALGQMPQPTGVPVTPVPKPGQQLSIRQIVDYFEKALGIPIRTKGFQHKRGRSRVWGLYYIRAELVRTHIALDLPVVVHEVGHHIADKLLGLNLKDPRWVRELVEIGKNTTPAGKDLDYAVNEGTAEHLRYWMTDPRFAFRTAPTFTAAWEEAMRTKHPALWKDLLELQSQIQGIVELENAERARKEISFDEPNAIPITRETWWQRFQQRFEYEMVDDLSRIRRAVDDMARTATLDVTENAYTLARLARGHAAKATAFMEHGVRDNAGRFTSRSLAAAIEPVKDDIENFAVYLVAKRAVELHDRENIRKTLKRPGPAIEEHAMTKAYAEDAVRKFETPAFKTAARAVYDFQDALLDYAVENGAVDPMAAEMMRELNKHYVPFQRVMDAWADAYGTKTSATLANRVAPYQRIKGSGRQIINPIESIVKNTHILVDMVEHNRTMQALTSLMDRAQGSGKWGKKMPTSYVPVKINLKKVEKDVIVDLAKQGVHIAPGMLTSTATVFVPATFANGKQRLTTVVRKGKRVFYEINDKPLFDALLAMGPLHLNTFLRIFYAKPAALLRRSVTLTPGFILRNLIRDNWVAMVQSKYGYIPVVDFPRALLSVLKKDELYQQFMTSGGAQAAMSSLDRTTVQRMMRKTLGVKAEGRWDRLKDTVMLPIDVLAAVSEAVENATRVGEFRIAKEAGGQERSVWSRLTAAPPALLYSDEEILSKAGLAGRDLTVDFQRAGRSVRYVNIGTAFLNARVQGIARTRETFKDDPWGSTLRVAPLVLLSMVLWALNHDDDHYRELPEWEKNQYWHLPAPWTDSGFIRFPKPQEYGAVFGNTMEAVLDLVKKEDPKAAKRLVQQLLLGTQSEDVGGGLAAMAWQLVGTAALPWVEVISNYDQFRGQNIVSPFDEHTGQNRWLEYNRWTSQTARQLGKLINQSPTKLEHIFYGYTGNMGKGAFEQVGDPLLHALGMTPAKPSGGAASWPGIGAFYSEGGRTGSAESVQRIYDKSDQLLKLRNDMDKLAVIGDFVGRAETVAANPDLVQFTGALEVNQKTGKTQRQVVYNPLIGQALDAMRDLRGEIDVVFEDTKMTPAQKRAAMNAINDRMTDIARMGLGMLPMRARNALPAPPVTAKAQ